MSQSLCTAAGLKGLTQPNQGDRKTDGETCISEESNVTGCVLKKTRRQGEKKKLGVDRQHGPNAKL